MNKNNLINIFNTIKSAFPQLSISIIDINGTVFKSTLNNKITIPVPSSDSIIYSDDKTVTLLFNIDNYSNYRLVVSNIENNKQLLDRYTSTIYEILNLLSQHDRLSRKLSLQANEMSLLLNQLFSISNHDDISYIAMSAMQYGYDLSLKRFILLFDFDPLNLVRKNIDELFSQIYSIIRNLPEASNQDLFGQITEHQFVLCKSFQSTNDKDNISLYLEKIIVLLNNLDSIPLKISFGGIVEDVSEYKEKLKSAKLAIKLSKSFGIKSNLIKLDDYILEYEMSLIPKYILDHLFYNYLVETQNSHWMYETIKALVNNDMDQRKTANSLFIHKNTLAFRIKQIREKFHLDPYSNDSDRFTLFAFYCYMTLYVI